MHLLYSIGLLGLASLAIPLLIHLWNVKQGKTLKIGSVALLGESAVLSSKSLRLTDWLLLLLRCLLLVLLVLLLCQPFIKSTEVTKADKGWIVVKKSDLHAVYNSNKSTIDSLLEKGYRLHDFNLGFKAIELNDTTSLAEISDTIPDLSLLRQLNASLASGFSVYLFSNQQLSNLNGRLPELNINLIWKPVTESDTVGKWTTDFRGKLYQAESRKLLTTYKPLEVKNETATGVNVLIHNQRNLADERYLRAALKAISEFSKRPIQISGDEGTVNGAHDYDIVFWLSNEPVDKNLLEKLKSGSRLFSYEAGKTISVNSSIKPGLNWEESKSPEIYKRTAVPNGRQGLSIWKDQFGNALLTYELNKGVIRYRFYTKLNQEWTNMVWQDSFVKALMPLLFGEDKDPVDFGFESHASDKRIRVIDSLDIKAVVQQKAAQVNITERPIGYLFWIVALIVFAIERTLSLKKKVRVNNE